MRIMNRLPSGLDRIDIRTIKGLSLAALLLTGIAVGADSRWRVLYQSDDLIVHLDKSRIERVGEKSYSVWAKYQFSEPQESSRGSYDVEIAKVELDCSGIIYRFPRLLRYEDDKLVYEFPKDSDLGWQELIPDTVGESIWTRACELLPSLVEN